MALTLPDLPYATDALQPHMSAQTFEFHHGKHHNAYVVNGNKLLEGTELADADVVDIIRATAGKADKAGIFNNAAQVWNHTFFWNSMKPNGGGAMPGALEAKIIEDFGSVEDFKTAFKQAGATQFGSGWAWLVLKAGKLEVMKTPNAETPVSDPAITPLLTCDVWEHAYYLDYQNRRPDFLTAFVDSLANWEFAEANMQAA